MEEQWKRYKFFTSIYRVSNTGRVKKHKDGEDLHICQSNGAVWLRNNWGRRQISIMRLMAICFLEMPDDEEHRAYRLDNTKPYTLDNIAWGTNQEVSAYCCSRWNANRKAESNH